MYRLLNWSKQEIDETCCKVDIRAYKSQYIVWPVIEAQKTATVEDMKKTNGLAPENKVSSHWSKLRLFKNEM